MCSAIIAFVIARKVIFAEDEGTRYVKVGDWNPDFGFHYALLALV
jgi:hypothetical protein